MKKNLIRFTCLALVLVMVGVVLASCGGPSGTYGDASGLVGVEYKFSGSKVSVTFGVVGFTKTVDGKFSMGKDSDGNKTITFTFEGSDASKYEGTHSYSSGKDDSGEYIKIDGIALYKKK